VGQGGSVTASATVAVAYPAPTVTLSAEPQTIRSGGVVTLTWSSTDAEQCTIQPDIGQVEPEGSIMVAPTDTTTYTIEATNRGGSVSASALVTVQQNTVPVGENDYATTIQGTAIDVAALMNDTDADGDPLTISAYTQPIHGTVLDAGNGLLTYVPEAEFSGTDLFTYTISDGFGGSATATVTVDVTAADPQPTVALSVEPETIPPGGTSTLTWSSTDADSCVIEPDVGSVDPTGFITVNPAATTTYTITATGPGGTATAEVTLTVRESVPIQLTITSPAEGETIIRPDVMVTGTILNPSGAETGVVVNGVIAMVHGTEFVANHVSLVEGESVIEAIATDAGGNGATDSVHVWAEFIGDSWKLTASPASGVAPLETIIRIDGLLYVSETFLSYSGPGNVEVIEHNVVTEYLVRIDEPGIYVFNCEAVDPNGMRRNGTIAVEVLDQTQLDIMLRQKWEGMCQALLTNDIDSAVTVFDESTREAYRETFTLLSSRLPDIVREMRDIQFIRVMKNCVEYDIRTVRNDRLYSFYLVFIKDRRGLWKVAAF